MENKNSFTIINDEGEKIVCNILFTFDSDETKKSYIVYTDNTKDDVGNIKVYASIYDPKSASEMELLPIETDKEWRVIEKILESIQEEIKNQAQSN
ncbi:MAG: DUF1292 domain-containing protein [Bacilli bacterium]|nr:DUF1292 domain-containing protein [Bacilli bacterium]